MFYHQNLYGLIQVVDWFVNDKNVIKFNDKFKYK